MRFEIGPWSFSPESHELRREGVRVKLEQRAALALQLLCERRGHVVTTADLVQRLWAGRQVSPNSLAVVIRDLRNALGDSARAPVFIETVPKAGYRLAEAKAVAASPAASTADPRVRLATGAAILLIAVVGVAGWVWLRPRPSPTVVLVGDLPNETGSRAYDGLAKASEGLVLGALGGYPGLRLCRTEVCVHATPGWGSTGRGFRFKARLVLWSGLPDLEFAAEDLRSSEIVWSGRVYGPEDTLPRQTPGKIAEFANAVAPAPIPPRR